MASTFFSKSKRKASGSATEEELTKKKKGNSVSIEAFNSLALASSLCHLQFVPQCRLGEKRA